MALATLLAVTMLSIAWSLWIRRMTWSCRWEVAATLNIALQGVAVVLMSPLASETLGPALYNLTGMWNFEDYLGHDAYIVAASAVVYNALGRLQDDSVLQASFRQYVERPATLCIPVLLGAFTLSGAADVYHPDFFEVRTDVWLSIYWLVLCGMLMYLLLYGARAMLILRRDPRSRRIANIYLVASISGIVACALRMITACVPPLQNTATTLLVWFFACGCAIVFAVASAHSWRIKTRWLTGVR